jgi:hypothetical protein
LFDSSALLIPLDTVYIIPTNNDGAGYSLTALLNSVIAQVFALSFSRRDRGAYRHFDAWVLGMLPLPEEVRSLLSVNRTQVPPSLARLLEISRALHADPERPDREALEREVDVVVGHLYGLDDEDMQALRDFYAFIRAPGRRAAIAPSVDAENTSAEEEA